MIGDSLCNLFICAAFSSFECLQFDGNNSMCADASRNRHEHLVMEVRNFGRPNIDVQ